MDTLETAGCRRLLDTPCKSEGVAVKERLTPAQQPPSSNLWTGRRRPRRERQRAQPKHRRPIQKRAQRSSEIDLSGLTSTGVQQKSAAELRKSCWRKADRNTQNQNAEMSSRNAAEQTGTCPLRVLRT